MSDGDRKLRPGERDAAQHDQPAASEDDRLNQLRLQRARQRKVAERAVQAKSESELDPSAVQAQAQSGFEGAGSKLPHLDKIQKAFGEHDVAGVEVHTGAAAEKANTSMSSLAYASGDRIAFGKSPDLHTAAHEAAHVVQQRAGQAPSSGVGKTGDKFERHADAVADAVVQGKSAKPLLDQMAGRTSSRPAVQHKSAPVQFLHGDLGAQSKVAGTTGSVANAAQQANPEVKRDANFNDAKKVELETKMANKILANIAPSMPAVKQTSSNVLKYIDGRAGILKDCIHASTDQALGALGQAFSGNTAWWGRLVDEQLKPEVIIEKMKALLGGAGDVHQHLLAHHQFMDKIFEKDLSTFTKAQLAPLVDGFKGKILAAKGDAAEPSKSMRTEGLQGDAGAVGGAGGVKKETADKNAAGFADRGRVKPGGEGSKSGDTFGGDAKSVPQTASSASGTVARNTPGGDKAGPHDQQSRAVDGATPPKDVKGIDQQHERGIDRWTLDESAKFMQEARIKLNMPLGAGISGTTTDLMTVARSMGVTGNNLHLYAVACLGSLEAGGAHTFHEIARACQMAGVPYKDGEYRTFFPKEYLALVEPELKELEQYKQSHEGAKAAPVVAAAGAATPPKKT